MEFEEGRKKINFALLTAPNHRMLSKSNEICMLLTSNINLKSELMTIVNTGLSWHMMRACHVIYFGCYTTDQRFKMMINCCEVCLLRRKM